MKFHSKNDCPAKKRSHGTIWMLALIVFPLLAMSGESQARDAVRSGKQVVYNVTFDNTTGSKDLTFTHPASYKPSVACMVESGPDSIIIKKGEKKSFPITTDNGAKNHCFSAPKYVMWTADDDESNWSFTVTQTKGHWDDKVTSKSKSGASGTGLPFAATCNGQDCLNKPVGQGMSSPTLFVSFR